MTAGDRCVFMPFGSAAQCDSTDTATALRDLSPRLPDIRQPKSGYLIVPLCEKHRAMTEAKT